MFDARAGCCLLRRRHRWVAVAPRLGFAASRVRSDGPLERIDQWDDGAVRITSLPRATTKQSSSAQGQKAGLTSIIDTLG